MEFPNDADGDALRRILGRSDMSKLIDIDFAVDFPAETSGEEVARLATHRGYTPSVEFDEDSQRWTCYCTNRMLLTCEGIVASQEELDELSVVVGGRCDGWGTFGD